jgi:hypothetical protein
MNLRFLKRELKQPLISVLPLCTIMTQQTASRIFPRSFSISTKSFKQLELNLLRGSSHSLEPQLLIQMKETAIKWYHRGEYEEKMEATLNSLFMLILELHHTDEYNNSLLNRAGEELKRLQRYVKSSSRTAQAFQRDSNLMDIIRAAEEDMRTYGAGIYHAVADLAVAIRNACWRWSDYGKIRSLQFPFGALEEDISAIKKVA